MTEDIRGKTFKGVDCTTSTGQTQSGFGQFEMGMGNEGMHQIGLKLIN